MALSGSDFGGGTKDTLGEILKEIKDVEENLDASKQQLKKFSKHAKSYFHAHTQSEDLSSILVEDMRGVTFEKSDSPRDPMLTRWAETMKQISDLSLQLSTLQEVMSQQLESLSELEGSAKPLNDARKQMEDAAGPYDSLIKKMTGSKGKMATSDPKIVKMDFELIDLKNSYEKAASKYLVLLKDAYSKLKLESLMRVNSSMFATLSFFSAGSDLMKSLEPEMTQTRHDLDEHRAQLSETKHNIPASPGALFRSEGSSSNVVPHIFPVGSAPSVLVSSSPEDTPKHSFQHQLNNRMDQDDGIVKEGELGKKRGLKGWSSFWFILRDSGNLEWHKKDKKVKGEVLPRDKTKTINLLLCTVKPYPDPKVPFCFEMITPERSVLLRASSQEEANEWLATFKKTIAFQISSRAPVHQNFGQNSPRGEKGSLTHTNSLSDVRDLHMSLGASQHFESKDVNNTTNLVDPQDEVATLLKELETANSTCADCDAPAPDWVSINLGVVVCSNCCGIHRSLGTHITKMRSMTLDKWDAELLMAVKLIGNSNANRFWEYYQPEVKELVKPDANSPVNVREVFIQAKYTQKLLTPAVTSPDITPQVLFQKLFMCAAKDDMVTVSRLLALGADLHYKTVTEGKTILHLMSELGKKVALRFFVANDGNLLCKDSAGRYPLHYAAWKGFTECVRMMIPRMTESAIAEKDNEGNTAADLARGEFPELAELLTKASVSVELRRGAQASGSPMITASHSSHSVSPDKKSFEKPEKSLKSRFHLK